MNPELLPKQSNVILRQAAKTSRPSIDISHRTASEDRSTKPDGGWGWVVVLSALVSCSLCDGYTYSTNQFYNQFLQEYGKSESITSLYCSVMTCAIMAISPFASGLITVYGTGASTAIGTTLATLGIILSVFFDRSVYNHVWTIGLLAGSGIGMIFISQVVVVSYWFERRIAMATGIAECGSGFGMAAFALVVDSLIRSYGWRGAQLILAGVLSLGIAFSAIHCKPRETIVRSWRRLFSCRKFLLALRETINFRLLATNCRFTLFTASNVVLNFCFFEPIIVTSDRMKRMRLGTTADAAQTMVYFGVANGIGRIVFGCIATCAAATTVTNNNNNNQLWLYIGCTAMMGSCILLSNLVASITAMNFVYFAFGLFYGGNVCLCSVVLIQMLGHEKMANAYAIVAFFNGFASLVGPPVLNQFVSEKSDTTAKPDRAHEDIYQTVILISGLLTIASALMLVWPAMQSTTSSSLSRQSRQADNIVTGQNMLKTKKNQNNNDNNLIGNIDSNGTIFTPTVTGIDTSSPIRFGPLHRSSSSPHRFGDSVNSTSIYLRFEKNPAAAPAAAAYAYDDADNDRDYKWKRFKFSPRFPLPSAAPISLISCASEKFCSC